MAINKLTYTPTGVCAQSMTIETEEGLIKNVEVVGGCPGNSQGVSKLLVGMTISEGIKRLEGIRCGMKRTSCPDQIAQALKQML